MAGGVGLISIFFIKDRHVNLFYGYVGLACQHSGHAICDLSGSIPPGKLGIYMGIFNFYHTSEIVNGVFGGSIVNIFMGAAHLCDCTGGILLFAQPSAYLYMMRGYTDQQEQQRRAT